MRKLTLALILGILIFGIVIAGAITNSRISIGSERVRALQDSLGGRVAISPHATPIVCDSKFCSSYIYQENIINTEWSIERTHCVEYSTDENNNTFCSRIGDYTPEELSKLRTDYVTERLRSYADKLISQSANSKSEKVPEEIWEVSS